MPSRTRKFIAAAGVGVAASAAITLSSGLPAHAISRAHCGSNYLQIFSNETTCWANAGTANVGLYGVVGYSSGNNAGYVSGPSIVSYFAKYASTGFPGSYTITVVHIN